MVDAEQRRTKVKQVQTKVEQGQTRWDKVDQTCEGDNPVVDFVRQCLTPNNVKQRRSKLYTVKQGQTKGEQGRTKSK